VVVGDHNRMQQVPEAFTCGTISGLDNSCVVLMCWRLPYPMHWAALPLPTTSLGC
jgi:hypothetical protein